MLLAIVLAIGSSLFPAMAAQQQASRAHLDVPIVKQPYNLCLAASVSMVLDYWGYKVTTDKLAEQVGVYKEGTIGRDYVGVVERLGLYAFLVQPPFDDVLGHVAKGRPVIVEVPERAGRHAMVVVGYDLAERKIFLNDPASGERKVQLLDDFRREWEKGGRWTFLIVPKEVSPPE